MQTHIHIANFNVYNRSGLDLRAIAEMQGFSGPEAQPGSGPNGSASSAGTLAPPALGERWIGQGGIYIGTIPEIKGVPARHLIAHPEENEGLKWADAYEELDVAKCHVDGAANTRALVARGEGKHPAAEWASKRTFDGHTDYQLWSRMEALWAWLYAPDLFKREGWYWTSTQGDRNYAIVQDFAYGDSYWYVKGDTFRVRAVRTIQL